MNPKELLQSLTLTGRHISSGFRRINPSDLRIDRSRQAREKLIGPPAIELKNLRRSRQFSTGPSATQHQHILLTNLAPIAETHGSDLMDDDDEEPHQRAYESVDNNPFLFHDSYTSTVYTAPSVRKSGDAIDAEGVDDEDDDNLPAALSQVRLALQDTNLELDHIIAEFERNSERQNERVSYSSGCSCICCIPAHFVGCLRDFWRRQRLLSARNFRLLFFLSLAIILLFATKWLYDMFRAARYPIIEDFQILKLKQWPLHDIESQNISFDTTSRERQTWNFDTDDSSDEAGHDGTLKNSSNSMNVTDVYELKVGGNIVHHPIVIESYKVAEGVLAALNSNSSELETRQWKGIAGAVALRELRQKLNITEYPISLEGTLQDNLCYKEPNLTCSDTSWFRSIDGKCNNMIHKSWGSIYSPFRRIILRKSPPQESLPSPDYVSEKAHGGVPREDSLASSLLPLWGMFILHDTVKIAQSPINCCDDREATNNISHNSEVFLSMCDIMAANSYASHSHANPSKLKDDCSSTTPLTNMLSAIYPACKIGPRSSFNLVTPYIDASNIYGSSEEISDKLREKHYGKLVVNKKWKDFLPSANQLNESCLFGSPVNAEIPGCVLAGDQDVNQIAHLTALNTIFLRQHNRIAHLLRGHNSRWNDTRLFHETRRIVIAQIQHITYNEFLPQLLGQKMPFKELALEKEDFYNDYDPEVNPSPSTAFAGAAGLFWYSMIGERVRLTFREEMKGHEETSMNISELIFSPKSLYPLRHKDVLGSLIKGLVSTKANRVGVEFPSQLRSLSLKLANTSVDLVRMVIEKGRDLEIPPYVEWRKVCGLSEPRTFVDLGRRWYPAARKSLMETYKHVEDVDLFSGMLAEIPIVPGRVGPTLACLLTDQFVRFRKGDRYWYESNAPFHHFTQAQLEDIRGTTLARILCSNLKLKKIQKWPMLIPNRNSNPILSCTDPKLKSQRLDFRHWEESGIGLQVASPESDDSSDSSDEVSSEIDDNGQIRIHAPISLKTNNKDDRTTSRRASSSNAYQKVTPKPVGLPVQQEHRLARWA